MTGCFQRASLRPCDPRRRRRGSDDALQRTMGPLRPGRRSAASDDDNPDGTGRNAGRNFRRVRTTPTNRPLPEARMYTYAQAKTLLRRTCIDGVTGSPVVARPRLLAGASVRMLTEWSPGALLTRLGRTRPMRSWQITIIPHAQNINARAARPSPAILCYEVQPVSYANASSSSCSSGPSDRYVRPSSEAMARVGTPDAAHHVLSISVSTDAQYRS